MSDIGDRFLDDFGWYTVAEALPALLGLATLVILSRAFSPADYGRYALVLGSTAVATTVCFGWLQQALLRFEPEPGTDATGVGATLSVVVTALVVAVAAVTYPVVAPRLGAYEPFYVVGVALVVARGSFRTVRAVYQARLSPERVTVLQTGQGVLRFGFGLVGAFVLFQSIVGWLWGGVAGTLVLVGVAVRRGRSSAWITVDRRVARRLLLFGLPLVGWLLGQTLLEFIDRLLLEFLRGSAAVGAYAANYSLASRGLTLVLAPVVQAAHPIVMNAWEGDNREDITVLVGDLLRYYLLLAIPATVGVAAVGDSVARLVLGDGFGVGLLVIPLVAGGLFFWNAGMIAHKPLEVEENSNRMLVGVLVAALLNLLLNVPLIAQFGATGAAAATFFSFASYPVYVYLVTPSEFRWRLPRTSVRNAAVASGVMLAPVAALVGLGADSSVAVVAATPACALVYLGTLLYLDELSPAERGKLRAAVRVIR